jgi:hypothetical protein
LFDSLNISGVDIHFELTNGDGQVGQSLQPVTLYLTVIVSPNTTSYPILPINATNLQSTEINESALSEAPSTMDQDSTNIARSTVATGSETLPPPMDQLPSEMSTPPAVDRQAGMSPAENALRDANEAMTTINLSKTWEGALERIKWVMDTLSPVAGVRCHVIFANPCLS